MKYFTNVFTIFMAVFVLSCLVVKNASAVPPVAQNSSVTTEENTPITFFLTASDPDSPVFAYQIDTQPSNGVVVVENSLTGEVTYSPENNFNGIDSFTFNGTDGTSGNTATVTITVNPDNYPPVANDVSVTTDEDTPITFFLDASDPDGDTFTYNPSDPSNGVVVVENSLSGEVTYSPDDNFNGTDSFTFYGTDGTSGNTATVTITVNPVNDAPVVENILPNPTVTEDQYYEFTFAADAFSDPDGDALSYTAIDLRTGELPSWLTFTDNGDNTGTFSGTLTQEDINNNNAYPEFGNDRVYIQVRATDPSDESANDVFTLHYNEVNDAPVAVHFSYTIDEDTPWAYLDELYNHSSDEETNVKTFSVRNFVNGSLDSAQFVPDENFNGTASFEYRPYDTEDQTGEYKIVTITVNPVNDAPVAIDDTISIDEDSTISINVLTNDTDVDGDAFIITSVDSTYASFSNEEIFFDASDFDSLSKLEKAIETVTYTISDEHGSTSTGTLIVTVNGVNDAPTVEDISASTIQNTLAKFQLIGDDPDSAIEYEILTQPTNGFATLIDEETGEIWYSPDDSFVGEDTFTYRAYDSLTYSTPNQSDVGTVTVTVENREPVVNNPIADITKSEDFNISFESIINVFSDPDGHTLTYSAFSSDTSVIIATISGSSVSYRPVNNQFGSAEVTVIANDGFGGSVSDTFTVTVTPVNDIPTVENPIVDLVVDENTDPVSIDLSNVFADIESSAFTYSINNSNTSLLNASLTDYTITLAFLKDQIGTATIDVTAEDEDGGLVTDSFLVTVNLINNAPTVLIPISDIEVEENASPTTIDLSLVFEDPDGDSLTYSVSSDNDLYVTPSIIGDELNINYKNNRFGTAEISVIATDPYGESLTAVFNVTTVLNLDTNETVNKNITSFMEIILNEMESDINNSIDGNVISTSSVEITAISDDTDIATVSAPGLILGSYLDFYLDLGLSISLQSKELIGNTLLTLTVKRIFVTGYILGLPISEARTERITFKVNVTEIAEPPVADDDIATVSEDTIETVIDVLTNDSDDDGDTITITSVNTDSTIGIVSFTSDSITYNPNAQFESLAFGETETDTFTYTISDGQFTDTATVTVTIDGENDTPIVMNPIVNVNIDEDSDDIEIDLSDVFDDIDHSDSLTLNHTNNNILLVETILNGSTLTLSFVENQNGTADIIVIASDSKGGNITDTFTITVDSVNDAPVASNADVFTDKNNAVDITLSGSDEEGDDLSYSIVSGPANGTLDTSNIDSGIVTYTPENSFAGEDTFTYQANDGTEDSNVATVTIDVINHAPTLEFDSFNMVVTSIDPQKITFFAFDQDGDDLTYSIVSEPAKGSLDVSDVTNGIVYYTPPLVTSANTSFTYIANDGMADSEVGTVNITVDIPLLNHAPTAEDLAVSTAEDNAVSIVLPANDIDGDELTYTMIDVPANGRLEGDAPNFTYYPNLDYEGSDTLTYKVNDEFEESEIGTVSIDVQAVNDAPSFQLNKTSINVMAEDGAQSLTNVIKAISPGSIYEDTQSVSFNVTTNNDAMFAVLPAISADGTFTFEPAADANGTAEVSITLVDDGGTEIGGVDTSETLTLFITIEGSVAKLLLLNSRSVGIAGATAQYQVDGVWMDLPGATGANGELELPSELAGKVKFRMVHNNTTQTITQNLDNAKTVLFQAVGVRVELINSAGSYITSESGDIEFNRSGWQSFGITGSNGFASMEMLPGSYNFRMTYGNARKSISQVVQNNNVVTFQTTPVTVSLKDSNGTSLTDQAEFTFRGMEQVAFDGDVANGSIQKELLPATYRFRATYENATVEIRQNVESNPNVEFQTKTVTLSLFNSSGSNITDGTAKYEYHSNGWNEIGVNADGFITVELLPKTYKFRIEHKNTKKEKSQNVVFNSDIEFETVNFTIELKDSASDFIPSTIAEGDGSVQYNAGGWQEIGETAGGSISIELLPNLYNFRMTYANASADQKNDLFQSTVTFNTESIEVELRDSSDELFVDADATVQYNAGGWQDFGALVDGVASKELLPRVYSFRMNYANATNDKKNDGFDPLKVTFNTSNVLVQLIDSAGFLLEDDFSVEYNSGGWKEFGSSNTGQVEMELLPKTYSIRLGYNGKKATQKVNVLESEEIVDYQTGQVVSLSNGVSQVNSGGWTDFYQNLELLPGNYKFKYADGHNTTYAIEAGFINEID